MENTTVHGPSGLSESGGIALPDVDALEKAAGSLRTHGQSFRDTINDAAGTWQGLALSYVSEEAGTVLSAFGKVTPVATRVAENAGSASAALMAFASTCRELRRRLAAYGGQVRTLDADISRFPTAVEEVVMVHGEQVKRLRHQSWQGDAGLHGRRQTLAGEIQSIQEEYLRAQDDCARALAMVSGSDVRSTERLRHPDLRSGTFLTEFLYDAGSFLGIEHGDDMNPWGEQTIPFRANGVLGEFQGFGAAAVEMVDGVVSLVPGTANPTKLLNTWNGIRTLLTDADSIDFGAAFSESLHLNDFASNGHWAAGTWVFGGASLLIPGGAVAKAGAGSSKLASVVGRFGSAAGRLGTAAKASSHWLSSAGNFLSRPGSLGAKISALGRPQTTEKILDALGNVKAAAWENTVVRALEGGAELLKKPDGAPGLFTPVAESLDSLANKVRVDHVIPDSAPRYPPNVFVDKMGNPVRVKLDDGTFHDVATRHDQISQLKTSLDPSTWDAPDEFLAKHMSASEFAELAVHRGADGSVPSELLELKVAEILHRNLDPQDLHGINLEAGNKPLEQALAPLAKRFYYDLTDEQAVLVHDLRHMMGTGDKDTWYQKVMTVERGEKYLDGTEKYPKTLGGFISKAADTADLRTVDEIILGLRLDYAVDGPPNSKYKVISHRLGEIDEMVAIRFTTSDTDLVGIPDPSIRGRLEEMKGESFSGVDQNLEPGIRPPQDAAVWPNTGQGFTSSRAKSVPVIPELSVSGGARLKRGAEMWKIDNEGNEVLIGFFNGKGWVKV
jgi:hypothetical protein